MRVPSGPQEITATALTSGWWFSAAYRVSVPRSKVRATGRGTGTASAGSSVSVPPSLTWILPMTGVPVVGTACAELATYTRLVRGFTAMPSTPTPSGILATTAKLAPVRRTAKTLYGCSPCWLQFSA